LALQNIIRPICLRHVTPERVLILDFIVMSVPVCLPGHWAECRYEEERPFVEVDFFLFSGTGAEGVEFVVAAEEIVDHGSRFQGDDAGVRVFEGRDSAAKDGLSVM
jgi:hypothetical protein